jgi:GNAT superfamily N-acetyltransferase
LGQITAPAGLTKDHDISQFDCGNDSLNGWLENKVLSNDTRDASRCFVICDNNKVIGYYAFATGAVDRSEAPSKTRRNMPNPIPVLVLGRLAIDSNHQGQRLGSHLLKDCMLRAIAVSEHVAFKALLVYAISEDAKRFYENFGFKESPIDPMTLLLSLSDIRQHFEESLGD